MRDFPFFRSTDLWHSLGEGRGSVKRGGGEKRGANLTARTRHVRLGLPFSEKKSFTRSSLARFKWIWGQSWKHDTQHTPISRGNANQFSEYCYFSVFILHFNFLRSLRPIYLSLRDQYTWHVLWNEYWTVNCTVTNSVEVLSLRNGCYHCRDMRVSWSHKSQSLRWHRHSQTLWALDLEISLIQRNKSKT